MGPGNGAGAPDKGAPRIAREPGRTTAQLGISPARTLGSSFQARRIGAASTNFLARVTASASRRAGEIEGIAFDTEAGEMIVLANRGKRIILGMPKGLYPGYDREIHELYVYSMNPPRD